MRRPAFFAPSRFGLAVFNAFFYQSAEGSMRHVLALTLLALAAFVLYRVHEERVRTVAEEVAAKAKAQALRSIKPAPPAEPPPRGAVAISRVVEPHYAELFADLNQQQPTDLVPPLEITKERILDKKTHVEAAKQPVYTLGISVLDAMIAVGEERTRSTHALLQAAARGPGTLDAPRGSGFNSGSLFVQGVMKRWEEERRRRKVVVDQLLDRLRTAERDWNRQAGEHAPVDEYDLPAANPVLITAQPTTGQSQLERDAYDQRRVMYPWRRSYYDQYRSSGR
jgi:hypothetical protein